MTNKIGPNELGKHPDVIKRAQQELVKMDVLVCGGCHACFHFINSFEAHKENCKGLPSKEKAKPDLVHNWAFALWKSAQPGGSAQGTWKLYQSWALLDTKTQQAWITAGQAIQTISRIGNAPLQETQVKVMRTVPATAIKAEPGVTPKVEPQDSDVDTTKIKAEKNQYQKVDNSTNPPTLINRYLVKRTMTASATQIEVRECLAEKVTSRRMNAKRATYEYFVKWSEYEGTWEPKSHFEKATELIAECDRKLAKQKGITMPAGSPGVTMTTTVAAAPITPGRPERSSKARAVSTMKTWCNTGDQSAQATATTNIDLKRKNTDSDYAEGEYSSQDESFGAMSPSPAKQIKATPPVVQKMVGGIIQRHYQKPVVNGVVSTLSLPSPKSAEVVIDKTNEKTSGVRRKPGVLATNPIKREAQVKVVGKHETTSSGIVRVAKVGGGGGAPTPPLSPLSPAISPRLQKVVQTTRTSTGPVRRTVYRTVPSTAATPPTAVTPTVTKLGGGPRGVPQATTPAGRPALHTYQVNRQGVTRTPQAAQPAVQKSYQVSPNNQRVVRTPPVAKPLKASPVAGRVVRSSPGVSPRTQQVVKASPTPAVVASTPAPAQTHAGADSDGGEMTLCPVTGKLITKAEAESQAAAGDDADSELQRLLTSEEEAAVVEAAAQAAAEAAVGDTQIHELIQNEDGSPVMITGDDGTVYQVAGKNAEGQTLLITQGEEGEQQCMIMAAPEEEAGGDGVHNVVVGEEGGQAMMVDGDSQDGQITAELVQADEPSADGTRRVVLLLPDGNLMVSELNEEQYQQFNLGG